MSSKRPTQIKHQKLPETWTFLSLTLYHAPGLQAADAQIAKSRARHNPEPRMFDGDICGGVLVENASDDFPPAKEARKSPSKLRRKFATNFAENFANFTLEIASA